MGHTNNYFLRGLDREQVRNFRPSGWGVSDAEGDRSELGVQIVRQGKSLILFKRSRLKIFHLIVKLKSTLNWK